jgi:hypothetical protein
MHILQDAPPVIGHVKSQIFLDLGIPGFWQILDLQTAIGQRSLNIG